MVGPISRRKESAASWTNMVCLRSGCGGVAERAAGEIEEDIVEGRTPDGGGADFDAGSIGVADEARQQRLAISRGKAKDIVCSGNIARVEDIGGERGGGRRFGGRCKTQFQRIAPDARL